MLMVIFGAGASYDSCSSFPPDAYGRNSLWHRPPLAKELFLSIDHYRIIAQKYSRFQPLIPLLESRDNIEDILEEFRLKAEIDEECRRQLWAIRFYISELIEFSQNAWVGHTRGVSNYKGLLDQVRQCSEVFFVTFNYDTLIENALHAADVQFAKIGDYVQNPKYKLVKLHGSIDWWLWIPKLATKLSDNKQPEDSEIIYNAPIVGERAVFERKNVAAKIPMNEIFFHLPALAIPTTRKQEFVCPDGHVQALKECVPRVTKIAVIGWRATEQHFLDMLTDGLKNAVSVIAVCGNENAANETLERMMKARIKGDFKAAPSGFSEFVANRRMQTFLGI